VKVTDNDTHLSHYHPSLIFAGKADSTVRSGYKHWTRVEVIDSDPHFHPSLIFVGEVGSILIVGFKH
jgi:hypothetical protein